MQVCPYCGVDASGYRCESCGAIVVGSEDDHGSVSCGSCDELRRKLAESEAVAEAYRRQLDALLTVRFGLTEEGQGKAREWIEEFRELALQPDGLGAPA